MAKDAKGHGSDGRGGASMRDYVGGRVASLGAALAGQPAPAAHQAGVEAIPTRAEAIRQWRDEGTSNEQVTRGIRALFGVGEYKGK